MINVQIPLLALDDGALLVPAEEVTALLRHIAGEYRSWGGADRVEAQAVADAAAVLDRLADQIDVECIAVVEEPG